MTIYIVLGQSRISNFIVKLFDNRNDAEQHIIDLENIPDTYNNEWYIEEHALTSS